MRGHIDRLEAALREAGAAQAALEEENAGLLQRVGQVASALGLVFAPISPSR